MAEREQRIGVITGDGIGPELISSAITVLDAVAERERFVLNKIPIDAGAGTFARTGTAISPESIAEIATLDATLKGPVGLLEVRNADGTEAGLLGGHLRIGLDLYANVRPIVALPGIVSRLQAAPGSIDYVIVRENTEGLYASRGKGVGNHWAMTDTLYVSRAGSERVARYAFQLAQRRNGAPQDGVTRVTCVDKANVLQSMYLFREAFLDVATEFPDVEAECLYVDAAAQALVMQPEHFDVIVTENLFGDILSDLGGGTIGGIALCPSGNVGESCAYFEPIHGSAPSIAGKDIANPIGQILASAMMLEHLGELDGALMIRAAVSAVLEDGEVQIDPLGRVVGGTAAATHAITDRL